jgi:hypothetical protein
VKFHVHKRFNMSDQIGSSSKPDTTVLALPDPGDGDDLPTRVRENTPNGPAGLQQHVPSDRVTAFLGPARKGSTLYRAKLHYPIWCGFK